MQLDPAPRDINFRAGTRLKLVDGLIVKRLRILDLSFLRGNTRTRLYRLEISVSHDQRDHIENVTVRELRSLLGAPRGAETLNRLIVEEGLAGIRLRGAVAERTDDSRNLWDPDSQRSCTELFDIFRCPCAHLWQQCTQGTKPLSTGYAHILSAFNLAEVVTHRPADRVAQREMQNFIGCSAGGNAAGVRGRLTSGHTAEIRKQLICLSRSQ